MPIHATARLTPEQQRALATDKNISVTAGAGSGKTTVLVERYLKILLEEDVNIRNVLAITFTEKAAAEMTDRVSGMIRRRLTGESDPRRRAKLLRLRERLNSAQISTIHAFCARILREFAVHSGVEPDFSIVSGFQQELIRQQAIDDVIDKLDKRSLESDTPVAEWEELLRRVPLKLLQEMLESSLQNAYEMKHMQNRFAAHDDEALLGELETLFFDYLQQHIQDVETLPAVLLQHLERLHAEREAVNIGGLKDQGRQIFDMTARLLTSPGPETDRCEFWQQLIDIAQVMVTGKGTPYSTLTAFGVKKDLAGAADTLKALSEAILPLAQFARTYFNTVPGRHDRRLLQALRRILELCEMAAARYRDRKEERGQLDFDDLQLLALEMIRDHEVVRNILRNRYRYIMVDEFQDTNQLQWEIISGIGMREGRLEADKFFVVGDPKQSIYGFRNADVRVFQSVKENFAGRAAEVQTYDGNVVLPASFRFLPAVNAFVNHVFREILQTDPRNAFEVGFDPLETRRRVPEAAHLEVALLGAEARSAASLVQETYIAQTIAGLLEERPAVYHRGNNGELLEPLRPGDIAILIARRTHLLELEFKLREYNIPFKTIGGVGFYRRQEIFDVYYLLRALDNPADDLALVAVLRSPFAGISDAALFYLADSVPGDNFRRRLINFEPSAAAEQGGLPDRDSRQLQIFRERLARWELRRDRLPLPRLLTEIFDESFYRATVAAEWNGEQLLANLDKIVEMARDFEQGGFMALGDFSDYLHQTILYDPREGEAQIALEDAGTVKIMTIHQAKGLEFPVVFCPYLQETVRGNYRRFCFDSDWGLAAKIRDPEQAYAESVPFFYQWLQFRSNQKATAEQKRLFYVAATRTRDRLYLVGSVDKNDLRKENPLRWAVAALDMPDSETVTDQTLVVDGLGVPVHIRTRVAPETENRPGGESVETALQVLENELAVHEKRETSPGRKDGPPHLQPLSDHPRGVTFSATQLLTFHDDKDAYFQRYHLGFFESDYDFLKESLSAEKDDPLDGFSLLKGKIIHKILEEGLPGDDALLSDRLERAFFLYEVFDPAVREKLSENVPRLIHRFAESPLADKVFAAAEWRAEISITMRLGEDYLTGTLDRLLRNAAGLWEVADYKTNNITAAQIDEKGADYEMQMKVYALLTAQLFPGRPHYPVALYFLEPNREYRREYTPKDIEKFRQEMLALIAGIKGMYPFSESEG